MSQVTEAAATSSSAGTDVAVPGRGTVVILKLEPKLLVSVWRAHLQRGVLYKTTIKSDDSFMYTPQLLQMTRNTTGWQTGKDRWDRLFLFVAHKTHTHGSDSMWIQNGISILIMDTRVVANKRNVNIGNWDKHVTLLFN